MAYTGPLQVEGWNIVSYQTEWTIRGPVTWATSILSFTCIVGMFVAYAPLSGFTKVNFYGLMISTMGTLTLIFAQSEYLAKLSQ